MSKKQPIHAQQFLPFDAFALAPWRGSGRRPEKGDFMAVYIDKKLCKGCALCVTCCPKKVFAISSEVNKKGFSVAAPVRAEDCVLCGLCEKTCPDLAIWVEA
jgi:2-oxoglutarate ferredoxin oxidoreductase subunit delta